MVRNEERDLEKFYNQRKNFRAYVNDDFHEVFMNMNEFAEIHDVKGRKVKCVLCHTDNMKLSAVTEGLAISGAAVVMYIMRDELSGFAVGESLRLDGKLYLVSDVLIINKIMQRVQLTGIIA